MNTLLILSILFFNVLSQIGNIDFIEIEPTLTTLNDLLIASGLKDLLRTINATVFAPNNDAFASLDNDLITLVVNNQDALRQVLLYHVLQPPQDPDTFGDGEELIMSNGQNVTVVLGQQIGLNDTTGNVSEILVDQQTPTGFVSIINRVLIPDIILPETTAPVTTTSATTTPVEPTTTGLSLPERNAQDIEELKRRVTALEKKLSECKCSKDDDDGDKKGSYHKFSRGSRRKRGRRYYSRGWW